MPYCLVSVETALVKCRIIRTAQETFRCAVDSDIYLNKAQKKRTIDFPWLQWLRERAIICLWLFFFNSLKASCDVLTYCWLIYDAGTYVGWEVTALSAVWFPSNSMDGSMKTVSFESAGCGLLRVVRRSYRGPFFFNLLIKHAPSLERNTTCCELVGNAGPAPIRLLSLHFLYIVFLRLYTVLSLVLLLLQFIEIYWVCEIHKLFQVFSY